MIPGINPKIVRRMLISRSLPHPLSKATPSGGRMTANINLKMSVKVKGILNEAELPKKTTVLNNGHALAAKVRTILGSSIETRDRSQNETNR